LPRQDFVRKTLVHKKKLQSGHPAHFLPQGREENTLQGREGKIAAGYQKIFSN